MINKNTYNQVIFSFTLLIFSEKYFSLNYFISNLDGIFNNDFSSTICI